jgi:hypothetical protein
LSCYLIGNTIQIPVYLRNAAGVLVDGATVALVVQDPTGAETSYPGIHVSTGNYNATFAVNTAGTWFWRWNFTGSVVAAVEGSFTVEASQLT